MAAVCKSEIEEIANSVMWWEMKNWEKTHALQAATSECLVDVGNVRLRFFLRPFEESVTDDGRTYTTLWYSLWMRLNSNHEHPILLTISPTVDAEQGNLKSQSSTPESQIALEERMDGYADKDERLVEQQFILMKSWTTSFERGRVRKIEIIDDKLGYKYRAEELKICITAALYKQEDVTTY